jgi:hypothetical protein
VSEFTEARSRPGARLNTGTDDRELWLTEFGELVLDAWAESNDYESLSYQRYTRGAKSDQFPIIGRKRDATEHEPGEVILGGKIESNAVEISVDKILADAVFIAEIDELLSHYEFARPYARQLGESLSTAYDRRIAIMHILASRETVAPYTGGPLPSYHFHASMLTDPLYLEEAAFKAVEHIKENDIGGGPLSYRLPWQQYLLYARYSGVQGTGVPTAAQALFTQTGRQTGNAPPVAGLTIRATNHIPNTNIVTGPDKYRGDFTTVVGHISNEMAVGTLNVRGMRVVMKEQEERLGTLIIASKLTGHGKLRCECAFEVRTDSR